MVDFFIISTRSARRGSIEIYPKFIIKKSEDLMIRGGDFYAIWLEEKGVWSTDEQDAIRLIDYELDKFKQENSGKFNDDVRVLHLWDAETGMIDRWHKYCQKQMSDHFKPLDETIIFANMPIRKEDYASKRLDYPLEETDISGYEKLMTKLYDETNRHKIEWCIGSIVSGDSKYIQKFLVLYGSAGTGKSTVLNIIQKLFKGYYAIFDSRALGSSNNAFALEPFKKNPLVAIQHDGDLSRIEDNTRLNSLVSHEEMTVNNKFEKLYSTNYKAFLIMATNKPVKITDAKSGILRRLIDAKPTGDKLNQKEYQNAVDLIPFELGGIAKHCLEVYLADPHYYDEYTPIEMMGVTNSFYNFVLDSYMTFYKENTTTLKQAWTMYKAYVEDAKVQYPMSQMVFKEELKNYFLTFEERGYYADGSRARNLYTGFRTDIFDEGNESNHTDSSVDSPRFHLEFKVQVSIFDEICKDCPAQLATENETPSQKWENVKTKLKKIDTSLLHYVKVPENHIVIDFDIPDENGEKSLEKNLEAAEKWPPTYAELSKSGKGIHLHYIYTGDVSKLSRIYAEHVEVKVFNGNSSLRRKLTRCNDLPIATINSGLPLKIEKGDKMVNFDSIKSENGLRTMIIRNLAKEIHPGTKPSIDFIVKILDDAYNSGLHYDISDMKPDIVAFAAQSTHQSEYCMSKIPEMKFQSADISENKEFEEDSPITFFDVEVFDNLFVNCWGSLDTYEKILEEFNGDFIAAWDKLKQATHPMINPSPLDIEGLLKFKLVGFNNKRYDNHILYGKLMGYNNHQLYNLSQRLINSKSDKEKQRAMFREAYNLSYTDIWDFSSNKQGLKKWEIELGIHHQELGLPWDKPVDPELWETVADYCKNDVVATFAVWKERHEDWKARQILADLSDGDVNMSTNALVLKLIFGNERHPELVYTNLTTGEQSYGR